MHIHAFSHHSNYCTTSTHSHRLQNQTGRIVKYMRTAWKWSSHVIFTKKRKKKKWKRKRKRKRCLCPVQSNSLSNWHTNFSSFSIFQDSLQNPFLEDHPQLPRCVLPNLDPRFITSAIQNATIIKYTWSFRSNSCQLSNLTGEYLLKQQCPF